MRLAVTAGLPLMASTELIGERRAMAVDGGPLRSILFDREQDRIGLDTRAEPAFFADLNLDQAVESITAGREQYDLKPFFYAPLGTVEAIGYRQEVLRDIEGAALRERLAAFARRMRTMREHLTQADKLHYSYQRMSWFLDAAGIYCDAVRHLRHDLDGTELTSRGLRTIHDYLGEYATSPQFTALSAETGDLQQRLSSIRYGIHIKGNRVKVSRYQDEDDYSADVVRTFEKFKRSAPTDYRVNFSSWPDMDHVEANILDLVARLFPDIFSTLGDYCERHRSYVDPVISTFDREAQFCAAYLEHCEKLAAAGLRFCYPRVSDRPRDVHGSTTFDLALAGKLVSEGGSVVCNDFQLDDPERILVVSGPNQGGKTTFARTFGQLHCLANLGCPVPGADAKLALFDGLYTHFEKEEDLSTLSGKLQDELVRIHEILERATPDSIVILNEIFTSTTVQDALFLSQQVMAEIMRRDVLCVWVTFIDELSIASEATVSMVSTVVPDDPARRTYKIVRRPADGLAYAAAIAAKYGLDYARLKGRIAS